MTPARKHVQVPAQSSQFEPFTVAIRGATKSYGLWAAVALLSIIGVLYYMRTFSPAIAATEAAAAEKSTGNVGGGGSADNVVSPLRKPHQCHMDGDCPDGTTCNSDGLCVPRLNDLPVARGESKLSRGREQEKSF